MWILDEQVFWAPSRLPFWDNLFVFLKNLSGQVDKDTD